jgi:hypothetical protein
MLYLGGAVLRNLSTGVCFSVLISMNMLFLGFRLLSGGHVTGRVPWFKKGKRRIWMGDELYNLFRRAEVCICAMGIYNNTSELVTILSHVSSTCDGVFQYRGRTSVLIKAP